MAKENLVTSFEDKLWAAADKLRGSIASSKYKDVVLGIIFLLHGRTHMKITLELQITNKNMEERRGRIFFIPHTDVRENMTIEGLKARYT